MKRAFTILSLLSALWLACGCSQNHDRMLQQLERLEQANRADSVMLADSLAEALAGYFASHGSANERMRAYYILGRTYFDMGELPKALEAYNQAVGSSDTAGTECDYSLLCRLHAQNARIFRMQYMPQEELRELLLARRFADKSGDSLLGITCYENMISPYYQKGMYDSVLSVTSSVYKEYMAAGLTGMAANSLPTAIYIFLKRGDLVSAKLYLDVYGKVVADGDNSLNRLGMLYSNLGYYHLYSDRPDSAIHYFKKQLCYKDFLENQVLGYKGLFLAYRHMGIKDSTVKYVELYNIANDSSNVFESADRLQRMESIYRYERNWKMAALNKQEAVNNLWLLRLSVCMGIAVILLILQYYRKVQSKDRLQMALLNQRYNSMVEHCQKAMQDLVLVKKQKDDFIKKKEKEVSDIKRQLSLCKYEQGKNESDSEDSYVQPIVRILHKKASAGNPASDRDMEDIFLLVDERHPEFFENLERFGKKLSHKQKCLCALTKLGFIPSEIGCLLVMRLQSVSNMRSRMALQWKGKGSSATDFDSIIRSLL